MIEVKDLTRRFGTVVAVDRLSFTAKPGRVTGFLGPNGSGKSTTMRCIVGLDRIEAGSATVDGHQYRNSPAPLHTVGVLLDAGYAHPGRTGKDHLRWIAASNGIPRSRVKEVLNVVGMASAQDKRVKAYSLGMRQRIGLAAAILGDPQNVILDEPANGLDPEGVRWIRDFLKFLASEGRTVLVSSHLLSEVALLADDLVVIGRGRLIDEATVDDFVDRHSASAVRVITPNLDALRSALQHSPARFEPLPSRTDGATIRDITAPEVGEIAAANGIVLHELSPSRQSLEDVFLSVTANAQEFATAHDPYEVPVAARPGGPS